jgi:hypothetical protein
MVKRAASRSASPLPGVLARAKSISSWTTSAGSTASPRCSPRCTAEKRLVAIQRSATGQGDHELRLLSPGAWGEPDLAPVDLAGALAEVAELEALWWQSRRRRRAGAD